MTDDNCSVLLFHDRFQMPKLQEIQAELESKDDDRKIAAVKQVILGLLAGEDMSKVLMHVIRYCITTSNKELKKILIYYWEVVRKYDAKGALLPQMLLVCNALLNDLKSPNEYVRAATLRFLTHIKDEELLAPLVPAVVDNLSYRHAYVRRNAVSALFSIYKRLPKLLPDAPKTIRRFLDEEADAGAKRNAFVMLFNCAQDLAIDYYKTHVEEITSMGDGMKLVSLELARKVCRTDASQKAKFIAVIFHLLSSESGAVAYEAANTLVSLSSAPTAIRAAADAYTKLLNNQSNTNVKLIVLDRIAELKELHPKVMQEVAMEILRALSSPSMEIRNRCMDIALDLVTAHNVEEVVHLFKKEITGVQERSEDPKGEFRALLINAIHTCVLKYPHVAESVAILLLDFLNGPAAKKVAKCVCEITEMYPSLRTQVLTKLMEVLPECNDSEVLRVSLWLLGEYCVEEAQVTQALQVIRECLGPLPLAAPVEPAADGAAEAPRPATSSTPKRPVVLADGTYASQSVEITSGGDGTDKKQVPVLRRFLLRGGYFISAAIAASLTKLALRSLEIHGASADVAKAIQVDCMLVMCAILELGETAEKRIDQDAKEQICRWLCVLGDPAAQAAVRPALLTACREQYQALLQTWKDSAAHERTQDTVTSVAAPEEIITVRQLRRGAARELATYGLDDDADIQQATSDSGSDMAARLRRVLPLTGIADPVYAEASVRVHDYDVVLDLLVANRTGRTLTNVSVEVFTKGDLKVVERPQTLTLGPGASETLRAHVKVSSTETGCIFGNITYQSSNSADKEVINMDQINVDIMDYIRPMSCDDARFREMWVEFEWENKIGVNTSITEPHEFVRHIARVTNMQILTPIDNMPADTSFVAANLYARSTVGEDALVNISVERREGVVRGHIRIRAKTQGVALSLGDRITSRQKP